VSSTPSRRAGAAALLLLLAAARTGAAEEPRPRADQQAAVREAWAQVLREAEQQGTVDPQVAPDRHTSDELVARFLETPAARASLELTDADRQRYLAGLGVLMAGNRSALAQSFGAAATNPRRVGLLERSGITDLVSAALLGSNLVSADESAVTVNLSAAALLCRACRGAERPAAARYRAAGWLNRLGGSFTFGAKVPEKEIVGFSGLPNADTLFDVVVWDVKLRLVGDRDPRAARWDRRTLGELGGLEVLRAMATSHPGLPGLGAGSGEQFQPLHDAWSAVIADRTARVARTIQRSLQVSVKLSGQHLTRQAGMNKYTGVLMADAGLGAFDGTLNVSYAAVQDVPVVMPVAPGGAGAAVPVPPAAPVTLKQWRAAAGLVGPIWKGVFVPNRAAELALSGEGSFPMDGPEVTLDRKAVYKADLALKVPISETLELPFSITYTNDPNELAKKQYVSGRIGITYDFGALKRLARGN